MNKAIFDFIFLFANRNAFLDTIAVFLAGSLAYFLVIAAFVVIITSSKEARMRTLQMIEALLAVILSRGVITEGIRFFYYDPRPFTVLGFDPLLGASGTSFPSAHAALLFALAMVVFYSNRTWGWWLLGLSALNGVARIMAGVHWPLDVAAGAVIGIGSAYAAYRLLIRYRKDLAPAVE